MRRSLAHRSDFGNRTDEVSYGKSRFRLTEAFHNVKPREQLKLFMHFGIQRFACGSHMLYRRKIVFSKVFSYHHTKHSGRRAERGNLVFRKKRQQVGGFESFKVINEHRALAHPLSVKLAPERFAPTRIGYGEMQAVFLAAVPVSRGYEMTERVSMLVFCHFGIARRAGGKEHKRRFVAARIILRLFVMRRIKPVFGVEIAPAFGRAVHGELDSQFAVFFICVVHDLRNAVFRGTDDSVYASGVEAVNVVVFFQLTRRGNRYRADFVKRDHTEPELIMTL